MCTISFTAYQNVVDLLNAGLVTQLVVDAQQLSTTVLHACSTANPQLIEEVEFGIMA